MYVHVSVGIMSVSTCICWYHVSICIPVRPDRDLLRFLPRTDQTLVAQHRADRDQDAVPPVARACRVCCSPVSHPGQAASHSCRGLRHHSPNHAWPQGGVLQTGRVRSAWRARLRQPPVLHQHVGHGLAHGRSGCCSLKSKMKFQSKWSLLVPSATHDAQCSPIAHIKPQWTVEVSWYMQIQANTCT